MQTVFTPTPLASFLAAIGLLRILAEQLDPEVSGCWRDGHFHLSTEVTPHAITDFLAREYRPSPHITPWNKDSGFPTGRPDAAFETLSGPRFAEIRRIAKISEHIVPVFSSSGRINTKADKVQLFQALDRAGNSDAWSAWLGICGVIAQNSKGEQDIFFPALLGGSGGAFGRADFGVKLMRALQSARREHFEAAIFGADQSNLLIRAADTMIYEPVARSDGQQGYGIATQDTHGPRDGKVNPAMLILVSEGLMLFEGYAITTAVDGEASGCQLASFTLAVDHNAAGHPSSSWLEDGGRSCEELWCPLWEEPCHYSDLRDALRRIAQLPLPQQLKSGTDFALFASRLGRRLNLSGFARYWFPARIGQGTKIPSLIEVFPLGDPQQDRSDALAGVVGFSTKLRHSANDSTLPANFRHAAERVAAEVEAVAGGGGSFAELLSRLVAWRQQTELSLPDVDKADKKYRKLISSFRFGTRSLPAQWFQLLERELDGPEWRLALALGTGQLATLQAHRRSAPSQNHESQQARRHTKETAPQPLATGRPYAGLADVCLLLEGRLDLGLVEELSLGVAWIERRGLPRLPAAEAQLPWLPPDYLAGLLLNQWSFPAHVPVTGDRVRWRELLLAGRAEEAMAVALHRLRVAEVIHWPWPTITHCDPERLLQAVAVPIHPLTLRTICRG